LKNRYWLNLLKWAWLIIVFGGVIYYVSKNFSNIFEYLESIAPAYLFFSFFFLIIGKLFHVRLSLQSVAEQLWKPDFSEMFYINSQMQLAKYLPGGVWHFVGRFGLYRKNGLNNSQASKSILAENIWLLLSAFFFGAFSFSITQENWLLSMGILLAWIASIQLTNWLVLKEKYRSMFFLVRLLLIQAASWFFFGASFWALLFSINQTAQFFGFAVGTFSISWAAGFVTIFAPSGLGVREVTMTFLLRGLIIAEVAIFYATLHRFVWVVTEIFLGLFCELFFGSGRFLQLFQRMIQKNGNHQN
jgi:glycosyltransferase 2 family protein